jgi:hypothetical protein
MSFGSTALVAAVLAIASVSAFADDGMDGAYLDKPYKNLVHPVQSPASQLHQLAPRSNTEAVIARQTPVRNQASRGTCSIFSATAMLEAMLVTRRGLPTTIDFSEEWLEYLIMRNRSSDGSNSDTNFATILARGFTEERTWAYIGMEWKSLDDDPLARSRCGDVPAQQQKSCLLGHRDPRLLTASDDDLQNPASTLFDREFLAIREEAESNKTRFLAQGASGTFFVTNTAQIKQLLAQGIPVTLDIDFYYGAWNHRKADELGIGRDPNNWSRGLVGYPEPGSVDLSASQRERAGHSVLLVGYDDNAVITTNVLMEDGTTQTFNYRGVYYFKNSWGNNNFGVSFQTAPNAPVHGGYGAITQRYADEFGQFFKMPIR